MNEFARIWKELSQSTEAQDGIVRRRLSGALRMYAGWSVSAEQPALVIEIDTSNLPPDLDYPQSAGFRLDLSTIKPGRDGVTRLVLESKDTQFEDIFPVLVQDVHDHVCELDKETELVRQVVSRLHRWQSFLKRHGGAALSESRQTGLWGELCFLETRLLSGVDTAAAVKSWQGPAARNQDFEFDGTAVEIKTTSSNPHEKVSIANVRQLEPEGLDNLYMYHIAVVIHRDSGITLPGIIENVDALVGDNSVALTVFKERLFQAGYLDSQAQEYENRGYHVLSRRAYLVGEGFPRIALEDIPEGVGDVKHTLVLSACKAFEIVPDPFDERGTDE